MARWFKLICFFLHLQKGKSKAGTRQKGVNVHRGASKKRIKFHVFGRSFCVWMITKPNFISEQVVHEVFPGLVITTYGENVLSSTPWDIGELISCTHEEADTRMFVHASHSVQHGLKFFLLRIVDTDVVVISTSMALKFDCERV